MAFTPARLLSDVIKFVTMHPVWWGERGRVMKHELSSNHTASDCTLETMCVYFRPYYRSALTIIYSALE